MLVVFIAWMSGDTFAQQNTKTTGSFRAAVVKVDITPETPQWLRGYNPRQSTGIHDPLYHRIVVLDDGKNQFFLISTDVVGIPVPEYDRVAEILRKQMGIDPLNVWWSVTHTHSAPEIATHFKGVSFPSMANRAKLAAEPGRSLTAEAGVLVTRVVHVNPRPGRRLSDGADPRGDRNLLGGEALPPSGRTADLDGCALLAGARRRRVERPAARAGIELGGGRSSGRADATPASRCCTAFT